MRILFLWGLASALSACSLNTHIAAVEDASTGVDAWSSADAGRGDAGVDLGTDAGTPILPACTVDGIDSSYGSEFAGTDYVIVATHLQRDGKMLVAGDARSEGAHPPLSWIARFDVNGQLDATFAGDGVLELVSDEFVQQVSTQPSGRILLLTSPDDMEGAAGSAFTVHGFQAGGGVDMDFGVEGVVQAVHDGGEPYFARGRELAVDSTGRIVIATLDRYAQLLTFGLLADGTVDRLWNHVSHWMANDTLGSAFDSSGRYYIGLRSSAPESGIGLGVAVLRLVNGADDDSYGTTSSYAGLSGILNDVNGVTPVDLVMNTTSSGLTDFVIRGELNESLPGEALATGLWSSTGVLSVNADESFSIGDDVAPPRLLGVRVDSSHRVRVASVETSYAIGSTPTPVLAWYALNDDPSLSRRGSTNALEVEGAFPYPEASGGFELDANDGVLIAFTHTVHSALIDQRYVRVIRVCTP